VRSGRWCLVVDHDVATVPVGKTPTFGDGSSSEVPHHLGPPAGPPWTPTVTRHDGVTKISCYLTDRKSGCTTGYVRSTVFRAMFIYWWHLLHSQQAR
jgi:hypothetical protein